MKKLPKLIYQRKEYTCGIACLQTVARLLGKPVFPTVFMEKRLGTTARTGTPENKMAEWAKHRLPLESVGENLWDGQLAIALVTRTDEDGTSEAHYEVFLGRLNNRIVSWCPYLATLRFVRHDRMEWRTYLSNQYHVKWSLNFKHRYSERELLKFLGMTGTGRLCLPAPAAYQEASAA